jgi:hypothetical protein
MNMWIHVIKPQDFAMKHIVVEIIREHGVSKGQDGNDE